MADNFEQYAKAVFLIGEGGGSLKPPAPKPKGDEGIDWDADFAVITAYNPDGKSPVGDEVARRLGVTGAQAEAARLNQDAHLRLKADLLRLTKPRWLPDFLLHACSFLLRDRLAAVTGCSPDLVHREPGWAANIPLSEALRLGRLYRQDAIFWVSGGALYLIDTRAPHVARGHGGSGAREMPTPELLGPWSERVRSLL